jgi:kynurenine 3-monooxygenase
MPITSTDEIGIVGAGLAGTLMSILLARRGHRVRLLERYADMRRTSIPAGRSINLALAARGIRALETAGVIQDVLPFLIPMRGRMLHAADGALSFMPYGQRDHEVIYSVSRPGLNRVLLDAAESAGVEIEFDQTLVSADLRSKTLVFTQQATGAQHELIIDRVIGADGAGSILRHALVEQLGVTCSEDILPHRYKELTLAADHDGRHRLEKNALHIWPRGGFMLIALPNVDGSFTVTLFLPLQGPQSFESLLAPGSVEAFFNEHFADATELMPQLVDEFATNPAGIMGTIRCARWCLDGDALLIGDAAHAITPFHGQGMNCAFEDCAELISHIEQAHDWSSAFAEFQERRKPNADAIADMALENYLEMRDAVRDPKFVLQKTLSLELEKRFPDYFVPRYSMVMFHDEIPYCVAFARGRIQSEILDTLTRNAESLSDVDFGLAATLISERLGRL